jgi:iron complex outermembrane receptor protein
VRTSFDLPYDTELDVMGRYVSELPGLGISDYMTMDVRLGWRPAEHVEVSLVGRNLIERRHQETSTELLYGVSGAPERSAFLKLRMDF